MMMRSETPNPATHDKGVDEKPALRRRFRLLLFCGAASFLLVALLNFTPLPVLLSLKPFIHVYHYESSDGGFRSFECPEKGRTLATVQRGFAAYQTECNHADAILYRTHERDWWKFWYWAEYLTHPRWRLPYRNSTIQDPRDAIRWTPESPCPPGASPPLPL